MLPCLVAATFLVLSSSLPQHHGGNRENHEADNRIILTARGEASYAKSRLEIGSTLAVDPHHSAAHGPYVQLVNGSTPTGFMQLGTPPKYLLVIFDTGSDKLVAKTWDTLSAELASIDQGVEGEILPSSSIYNHNSSSTYRRKLVKDPRTNDMVPEKSEIAYGSGMAITDEGNDTVKIGNFILKNFSLSEITTDSLALLHTKKGISGVLGLQHMKNKSLGRSLFSRMRDAKLLTSFGYCRGTGDNGSFIWGDDSTEGLEVPVIGQMHWAVKIGNIKMIGNVSKPTAPSDDGYDMSIVRVTHRRPADGGQEEVEESSAHTDANASHMMAHMQTCPHGNCTGILDTGSNIIAGPTHVMKALSEQANVATDCSNFHQLPLITFDFGDHNVTVHPEGYVMKVPMPKWASAGGGGYGDGDGDGGGDGDGDGDGQGASWQDNRHGDGSGSGQSLDEEEARDGSGLGWKAVFRHLRETRGIDLSVPMRGMIDFKKNSHGNTSEEPEFLCMPALVPIDKQTEFGPLYIIGTPLLQSYYARWSFAEGADSPRIHLKKLTECHTCKETVPTQIHPADDSSSSSGSSGASTAAPSTNLDAKDGNASLEAIARVSSRLMRSEQHASSRPVEEARFDLPRSRGPMLRNIEDISYPHWAKDIMTL
jgi:hypothetical protein